MTYPPRLFNVYISEHARQRARERFPGYKAARISDEVRAAFAAGRTSSGLPSGIWAEADPDSWYAWTEDGERVFVLALNHNGGKDIAVVTVMRASTEYPDRD
jgi:hypothetical protein